MQYSLLDRSTGDAFVRFKHVDDAKRVWEGGSEGLDGSSSRICVGREGITYEWARRLRWTSCEECLSHDEMDADRWPMGEYATGGP